MSLESFRKIRPQQHTLCLSPCMQSPCRAVTALVCKGFLFVPLVDCNCPGSASNRRENVEKTQKEYSKVLNIMPRWWSHGSNDLRGVFGLVQIHRTASCQRYFKSGPKTSVNTPVQKHTLHTVANTHHVSHVNSHMLLIENMGFAVIVNLSLLFIIQLRCPNTQLKCEWAQSVQAHHPVTHAVQYSCLLCSSWPWIPDGGLFPVFISLISG